jgi:hypothetical protein
MASYRIICTVQEPFYQPTTHAHIIGVGTGTTSKIALYEWTVDDVWAAIDQGNVFYTVGETTGKVALVNKYTCCRRKSLRSAPDTVWDNNLDYLPRCARS